MEKHLFDNLSILMHEPEHAKLLGQLIANWALCESTLMTSLGWVLSLDQQTAPLLYDHFTSTRSKIELIIRLNRKLTADNEGKAEIEALMKRALALNSMRNSYVHATWGRSDQHRGELLRTPHALKQATSPNDRKDPEWISVQRMKDDIKAICHWEQECIQTLYNLDKWRLNAHPDAVKNPRAAGQHPRLLPGASDSDD